MKGRSIPSLMVCLGVFGVSLLPALAQSTSQRYTTNTEIQRIIREFRQQASTPLPEGSICCRGSEKDPRSPATRRLRDSFVRAWSRVNPDVTPFLGMWVSNNASVTVYPSNIRGRACVILAGTQDDYEYFSTGTFRQGFLRLNDGFLAGRTLVRQQNQFGTPFLLTTGVYNQVPKFTIYIDALVYRPNQTTEFISSSTLGNNRNIIQQFNAAGCTASLPKRR